MLLKKKFNLQSILTFLLKILLFLLPWQTIYIYRQAYINGVKWEYGTLGFYGSEILLWVIIFLFMIWYWRQYQVSSIKYKVFKFSKDRLFLLACLSFIIYHLSSIIWSSDKDLALQQSLRVMEAILLFLVIFIGSFEKVKLAKWFIVGAIIPSLLGMWQFLLQTTVVSKWFGLVQHFAWVSGSSIISDNTAGRWLRAYGSFNHPNVFGGYLTVVIIVTLLYFYISKNKRYKILSLISYLLSLTALFFTFSRSAWLAVTLAIFFVVIVLFQMKEKFKAFYLFMFSLLLGVILTSLFLFLVKVRMPTQLLNLNSKDLALSEQRSIDEREAGYQEAWQIFKQHPLFGVGAGNYTVAAYYLNPNRPGYEYQPVHNVIVLFIVEQGIVGLLLFLFVIWSFFRYQISDNRYQYNTKSFCWCYLLSVICYLTLASFDHYLYSSYVGLMFGAVFSALILAKKENNTNLV